jgi:membrane protein DedA with SNARE-associated domain
VSWLSELWLYVTLGATSMLAEEAAPLIGGLAAHEGRLALVPVIVSIGVGTWVLTVMLYYTGRWRDRWVRKRFPRFRGFVLRAFKVVRRHPWRASLLVRWVFGLRLALPIACGAARVPAPLFLVASALSCFAWTAVFVALGWVFGETARRVLRHVTRYDEWVFGIVVVASVVGWYIARTRRRRLERRAVDVIGGREERVEERKGL